MKCVKIGERIVRVSDEEGRKLVKTGKGKFCPKQEFKAQERGEK